MLAIVFLMVLFQVLVLSFFGLQALEGQVAAEEKKTRDLCRRLLSGSLVKQTIARIHDAENSIGKTLRALKVESPRQDGALPQAVESAVGPGRIFSRAFIVDREGSWYDAHQHLLWPARAPPSSSSSEDGSLPFERIQAEVDRGGEVRDAIRETKAALSSPGVKLPAVGLALLARLAYRSGDTDLAMQSWDRICREFPTARDVLDEPPVPLGPLAAAHRAEERMTLLEAGKAPAGALVDDLLDLSRILLANRFQLDAPRLTWETERLDRLVAAAKRLLDAGDRDRLDRGIASARREEGAMVLLHRAFGDRIDRVAAGKDLGGAMRRTLPAGPRVVYAVPLSSSTPTGAVVFELDLAALKDRWLPGLLSQLPLPEGVSATVLDTEGRTVVPGAAAPKGPVLTQARFGEPLPFWTPVVYLDDPGALERRDAPARRLHQGVMFLAIAGLVAAGLFLFRLVRSEIRVARLKSDFLSNVTHELKTPLTSIRMFVETLQDGRVRDEAERKECIDVISRETDRLTELIQRVLDLARFEGKKKPKLSLTPTSPKEVIDAVTEVFSRRRPDGDLVLSVDVPPDLPRVPMDTDAIEQVLLNLLSNAAKYGGKSVRLTAERDDGSVKLAVEDDGIGIAKEEQQRIFDKFYRVEDNLARDVEGSGLGLALASEVVAAHGGRIEVKSQPGRGSRFTVVLPVEVER